MMIGLVLMCSLKQEHEMNLYGEGCVCLPARLPTRQSVIPHSSFISRIQIS
jgi:hypothetical protein